MKAPRFDYHAVQTIDEALGILASPPGDVRLLAGGQSLVAALNLRLSAPDLLLDISRLSELRGISDSGGVIRIGALTTHAEMARSPVVAASLPLLSRAAAFIAHPAIRNRGTIGGSLALADPAAEWPACLLALGGSLRVCSQRGERLLPAPQFFRDIYETDLQPDELLISVEIVQPQPGGFMLFDEFARRRGDFAMAGLALCGRIDAGRLASLRFGFLGVGRTPLAAERTAAALLGMPPREAVEQVGALLAAELEPANDHHASADHRLLLARVLAQRLLLAAAAAG